MGVGVVGSAVGRIFDIIEYGSQRTILFHSPVPVFFYSN